MFPNLRAEIIRKGFLFADVAAAINRTESTFSQKMNGKQPFLLSEAFAIKKFLKTEMSLDELFAVSLEGAE